MNANDSGNVDSSSEGNSIILSSYLEYPMIGNTKASPTGKGSHKSPTGNFVTPPRSQGVSYPKESGSGNIDGERQQLPQQQQQQQQSEQYDHQKNNSTSGEYQYQSESGTTYKYPHQYSMPPPSPSSPLATENYYAMGDDKISKYIRKEQQIRAKSLDEESVAGQSIDTLQSTNSHHPHRYLTSGKSQYALQKSFSLSIAPTKSCEHSIPFDNGDWTPVDSSYGGAFPFCGWIPKKKRQAIEKVLLVAFGIFMIYSIVSVATILTGGNDGSHSSNWVERDDDNYVQNHDDTYYQTYQMNYDDDDDYLNDDYMNRNRKQI
eukprot:CAMPEP_0194078170 /NCGR_PEP_ID=MMETSP0149-20130528/4636_1 /TAXON_ID=122233 /ORGANISM="Chaetoceros debilis, Strain MM31A-1" /LENGTH=318 /DNA_ID=CAMNT_0038759375 /DNA_START=222 /DNA_END=1178 /DNA_ORIENTATION=+